jgi:membrane protein YdbS with pleckstrin-like domain
VTNPDQRHDIRASSPASIRRKLFFGLALFCAFGSMYAGLYGGPPWVQYGLAIVAVVAVMIAVRQRAR